MLRNVSEALDQEDSAAAKLAGKTLLRKLLDKRHTVAVRWQRSLMNAAGIVAGRGINRNAFATLPSNCGERASSVDPGHIALFADVASAVHRSGDVHNQNSMARKLFGLLRRLDKQRIELFFETRRSHGRSNTSARKHAADLRFQQCFA